MAESAVSKRGPKYFWKEADKSRGVAAYCSTGSYTKAAAITGIPENTLRLWSKQEWWAEESLRANRADSDELKSTFTRIAKKATAELEDRLDNGDEVLDKEGNIVKKRIGGSQLAIIAAVAADKRRLELDTPNTVAVQNTAEKLQSLMVEFLRFTKARTGGSIIDAEVINAEQPQLQTELRAGTQDGDSGPQEGTGSTQRSAAGND